MHKSLSLLLALVMVFGLLPTVALAADVELPRAILEFDFSLEVVDDAWVGGVMSDGTDVWNDTAEVMGGVTIDNGIATFPAGGDDTAIGIKFTPSEPDPMDSLGDNGATIAMWVKSAEETFSSNLLAYGALNDAGTGLGASVQIHGRTNANAVVLYRNQASSTGGHKINSTTNNFTPGKWQLVTLVENADGSIAYYIDGAAVGTHAATAGRTLKEFAADAYDDSYYIGYLPYVSDGDTHFVGAMDCVTIYDGALTAAEVAALYEAEYPRYEGSLTAESVTAETGTQVNVPVTLENLYALTAADNADGIFAAIQFSVEGAEVVDFVPSDAFPGYYDWSTLNNIVMGFNLSFTEPSLQIADLGEDLVIGELVIQTADTAGTAEASLIIESICGDNAKDVSSVVTAGTFTVTTTAHEHTAGDTVVENKVEADCENGGSYDNVVYCSTCGEEMSRETVTTPALNHDWDDGVVTKEPTTTETGVKTYTCGNCGDTKTEDIPMIEVELFDLYGANNVMGNALGMYFYIEKADLNGTDYYAKIVKTYADGTADRVVTYDLSQWESFSSTLYRVYLDGIAAKEMTDTIYVTIYNGDGTPASNVWVDSMRDYGMRALAAMANSPVDRAMYADMLNYGAAAQTYFNYHTDDLANSKMTDVQKSYATESVELADYRVKGANYYGSALTYADQIEMTVYFNGSSAGKYAVVEFTDHYGEAKTVTIDGSEFFNRSSDLFGVIIDEVVVADYRQIISCTVYNADGTVYGEAADSMESYACRALASDPLYEAAAKFSSSAYNYLHQ